MPKRSTGTRVAVDWSTVDWSDSDPAIARKVLCSRDTVAAARRRLGIPPYRQPTGLHHRDDIDWTRSNAAIARELGCTHGTIRTARWRRHAQNPPPSYDTE